MNYKGTIIEESLENKEVLKHLKILKTEVEKIVEKHQTPWLNQWTKHIVEIDEDKADQVARIISMSLDREHSWYADYKNNNVHYIIYRGKIFKVNRTSEEQYLEAKKYGISLGIPEYQVDFSPEIEVE